MSQDLRDRTSNTLGYISPLQSTNLIGEVCAGCNGSTLQTDEAVTESFIGLEKVELSRVCGNPAMACMSSTWMVQTPRKYSTTTDKRPTPALSLNKAD